MLRMRYLLSMVLACFLYGPACAQVVRVDTVDYPEPVIPPSGAENFNTDFWYTIGINGFAYQQFPQVLSQPSGQPTHPSYLNGIIFKLNDNQISYRLQAAYFEGDISFDNECEGCETATGLLRNTAVKVGFEKSFTYSRFQPYIGSDVGFMVQRFEDGVLVNDNLILAGEPEPLEARKRAEDSKNALLVSPFVGFKLFVTSRIALAAEANFNIAYTYQKSNTYQRAALATEDQEAQYNTIPDQMKRYRWEYFFAPVASVSMQNSLGLVNR